MTISRKGYIKMRAIRLKAYKCDPIPYQIVDNVAIKKLFCKTPYVNIYGFTIKDNELVNTLSNNKLNRKGTLNDKCMSTSSFKRNSSI